MSSCLSSLLKVVSYKPFCVNLPGFIDGQLSSIYQLLEAVCPDKRALGAKVGDKLVHLAGGAVVHGDREAVVGDISGEVLAHDGEAGKAKVWFLTQKICSINFYSRDSHHSTAPKTSHYLAWWLGKLTFVRSVIYCPLWWLTELSATKISITQMAGPL